MILYAQLQCETCASFVPFQNLWCIRLLKVFVTTVLQMLPLRRGCVSPTWKIKLGTDVCANFPVVGQVLPNTAIWEWILFCNPKQIFVAICLWFLLPGIAGIIRDGGLHLGKLLIQFWILPVIAACPLGICVQSISLMFF